MSPDPTHSSFLFFFFYQILSFLVKMGILVKFISAQGFSYNKSLLNKQILCMAHMAGRKRSVGGRVG